MKSKKTLTAAEKLYLKKIGLSKSAVGLYELLMMQGELTAQMAAEKTGAFASAQYRLFRELEQHQLVRHVEGWPRRFEALPVGDGLQASLVDQQKRLESLVVHAGLGSRTAQPAQAISILVGRQKVYDAYNKYARQAEHQISIFAIGIAYSEEFAMTQAAALKRGVTIRHVVQEVTGKNYYVIDRWLKLGIELRVLQRPRGYHLSIIDDKYALVTFSNPEDTEQRVSLLTTDKSTIAIFQAQFEAVWRSAKPLNFNK
jgi:sugar-specific transcriptional regulator TrmB